MTNPSAAINGMASIAGPSTYARTNSPSNDEADYLRSDDEDEEEHEELVKMEDGPDVLLEEGADVDNEEPLYVNAKQYHRILKRRAARQRLEELNRLARSRKVSALSK